ncbi:TlpA family protein disulfide reductase [Taibaiella soli]|uniref:Thioredoxin domain-containing protein n=1 Tax=Taibaiella soli TaxID=1649169 RepID=A0A2W2AZG1_9BACT|nr:TlpA disulfide reductase family protein [Taibaiella soli]PZF73414.1 hypothetical protein DN068_08465 [Taibaiella soli]
MKRSPLIFALLLFPLCAVLAQKKKKSKEPELHMMTLDSLGSEYKGQPYPDFSFTTLDGKRYNAGNTRGKVVYLNFWFEACVPCHIEFDALNHLYDSLKNDTSVIFAALTFETQDQLPAIVAKEKLRYPVASLSKEECSRLIFDVGYPTSIVIDKTGKIALYETGGFLQKEKAEDFVFNKLLPTIRQNP